MRAVEDQIVGDVGRPVVGVVDPAIGAVRRDRAQDRFPLVVVERRADPGDRRQQHVIFDVEDARGVVGALDDRCRSARSRRSRCAAWCRRTQPRISAVSRLIASSTFGRSRSSIGAASMRFSAIQASLMLSQVSRVSAVRTMRALMRAVSIDDIDARRVGRCRAAGNPTRSRPCIRCMSRAEADIGAGADSTTEFHSSSALCGAGQRHAQPGIDQTRHVLRPLDVAVHPVEAVGGATEEHQGHEWCMRECEWHVGTRVSRRSAHSSHPAPTYPSSRRPARN